MLAILKFHMRKMVFALFVSILYYFVASPTTYNSVGSLVGLTNYDNPNIKDRDTLLYVHSVVMGFLTFLLLFFYNPMNAKCPSL